MEPPLDPNEIELIPNQIVVFEEDLSNWADVAPEYVGPPAARMKRNPPATVQPAPAIPAELSAAADNPPTKSV